MIGFEESAKKVALKIGDFIRDYSGERSTRSES